jgi:hypothetical protein
MNETIKEALAKGKALREELDKEAEEKAKRLEEQQRAMAAIEEAVLQNEAERYLSYVPDGLTKAVAERKNSFRLMTYESDKSRRFHALAKLIEPKLKEMGLQFKHTTSTEWRQLSYDPDTGYDASYYDLYVLVPDETL